MDIFIKDLMKIGLTEIEAKIYINLLKKRHFTATEIATISKINRTQTYDLLSKLVKKGLCVEIYGNKKKYEAISPEIVMNNFSKEFENKKEIAGSLSKHLSKVFNQNINNQNPLDFIKVLRTNQAIREHVYNLLDESEVSIKVFNKPPYSMSSDQNQPESESIVKGVEHRCVYEVEDDLEEFLRKLEYFASQGEKIRINNKLPLKLAIFDNQKSVMTLYNEGDLGGLFTAMSVEHKDFTLAMSEIFEMYWQVSMTIDEFKNKNKPQ